MKRSQTIIASLFVLMISNSPVAPAETSSAIRCSNGDSVAMFWDTMLGVSFEAAGESTGERRLSWQPLAKVEGAVHVVVPDIANQEVSEQVVRDTTRERTGFAGR